MSEKEIVTPSSPTTGDDQAVGTRIDQWQSQIFARVLKHATVVFVSSAPDKIVQDMHMIPAHSLPEALKKAEEILGDPRASIAVVPDGVGVMVS